MFKKLFKNLFLNKNDKILKKFNLIVQKINSFEKTTKKLTDKQLSNKTEYFKKSLKLGKNLDDLLPEAFSVVREASIRTFGMRHFDVQLLGGIVLNNQSIAEMKTGEGKTLTSTLPAYLNSLIGKGVHIVTMNDYLAKRDAENNTPLFKLLKTTVGLNTSGMSQKLKKKAYLADITYGTNNEYAFDYLKDNMVLNSEEKTQRNLYYALIDEIDSILIDEARTPLIISNSLENRSSFFLKINNIIHKLKLQKKEKTKKNNEMGDFYINKKQNQIYLTERGLIKIEKILIELHLIKKKESLYLSSHSLYIQHVIAALKAHYLFKKNVDYIIKNNSIVIVDEHTGRIMPGRRWSDGIHQAIEAKEKVFINNENQTLASITFQNYFKLYKKLSGMTGTAITESKEFYEIYKLNTIVIPTNNPMIRKDLPDLVFTNRQEKMNAIILDIKNCVKKKQPILVGTISIEKSEIISKKLKKIGIKHNVLNAKSHEKEAKIIAEAGTLGMVTIATNMAGRGTDIVLGGSFYLNQKKNIKKESYLEWKKNHNLVLSVGGLHIIGTERHESRRIDNQLCGRAGRQGDIGSSQFYISLEDSLIKTFASKTIIHLMKKLVIDPKIPIKHKLINQCIQNAQKKIDMRNFDIRKQLIEYDNIIDYQRNTIYKQRNQIIESKNICQIIDTIAKDVFQETINRFISKKLSKKKEIESILKLEQFLIEKYNLSIPIAKWFKKNKNLNSKKISRRITNYFKIYHYLKKILIGKKRIQKFEKEIFIKILDLLWIDHLSSIENLQKGIHLRSYAQKDPKQEYKRESFEMFIYLLKILKYKIITTFSKLFTNLYNNEITFFSKNLIK